MAALDKDNRKKLEKAVRAARKLLETGDGANKGEAVMAIELLAVHEAQPYRGMSDAQKALRRRLRVHGRQLGDAKRADDTQEIRRVAAECAYEHWHRMLFARFLAENNMLIEPESNVAVTLDFCRELAEERHEKLWDMVGRFAQKLLPAIFRPDDPVLEVSLELTKQRELEALVENLPKEVFVADDSLGWVYQFWQADEKDRVNASEVPIGANELPAVTQLFTEHYMVQFLLHNTLGAWHAAKILAARPELARDAASEQVLRDAVALPGYTWDYLRFVREGENSPWRPAAGPFAEWPRLARDLKTLDPCCGSGHFLVELFTILLALRRAEEHRPVEDLIREVLRNNLRGLELDPRCTQIAAFAVALAAWKAAGRVMPDLEVHVACSGISVGDDRSNWENLAGRDARLREAMGRLFDLFEQAPLLGSLIDPQRAAGDVFTAGFSQVRPLLEQAVQRAQDNDEQREAGIAAVHVAEAVRILTDRYHLVTTNVPYLGLGRQNLVLKKYCSVHHKDAKNDLATCFVERGLRWCAAGGTIAFVTPQNWLYLTSYRRLRENLLRCSQWSIVARLGVGAFETIGGHIVNVALLALNAQSPSNTHSMAGLDVSAALTPNEKAKQLRSEQGGYPVVRATQVEVARNADARIILDGRIQGELLEVLADSFEGIGCGDLERFSRHFAEVAVLAPDWKPFRGTTSERSAFAGVENIIYWQDGHGDVYELAELLRDRLKNTWRRGSQAWGKLGIAINRMGDYLAETYLGEIFDSNIAAVIPHSATDLPAIHAYVASDEFLSEIRRIDQSIKITNVTFLKVPFDRERWHDVARARFPHGLPLPQTNAPTHWHFHGHPAGMTAVGLSAQSPFGVADPVEPARHPSLNSRAPNSTSVLQVGVARLLGYRWPAELDSEMRLDVAQRAWVERCAELADHADGDGIVCLASLRGEDSAADRLRKLLAAAFGSHWKSNTERQLLEAAGAGSVNLDEWLRDFFFEQHLALFHNTPFVWHIWDGRKDGFHALVNYHKLAEGNGAGRRLLESLTHTYLGDWISRQEAGKANKETGAENRLAAALTLKAELEKIIQGEPPYDIFVRWKPLHKQAMGWEPDINDGVRLNIRPFMLAKDVGKKGAGILRAKPNLKWRKDRGGEPNRPKADFPWFWGWDEATQDFMGGREFDGNRHNDLHYTRAAKQKAREKHGHSSASRQGGQA